MEFDYGFEYSFPEIMEGAAEGLFVGTAGVFTGLMIILYLLLMGVSIAGCVLNAVGMYRIAKRRGIHHAWLAWIPIGCNWLLGSISDHYQYIAKKKTTKRRRVILILSIILVAATILFGGGVAALIISSNHAGMAGSILSIALMVISYLAMLGLAVAITVFCYIAYFDLFRSCRPEYDVLFLVLSILFTLLLPFFVFACGDHDKGMPARRSPQQPPVEIPYTPEDPVEEEIPVVEAELVEEPEE